MAMDMRTPHGRKASAILANSAINGLVSVRGSVLTLFTVQPFTPIEANSRA